MRAQPAKAGRRANVVWIATSRELSVVRRRRLHTAGRAVDPQLTRVRGRRDRADPVRFDVGALRGPPVTVRPCSIRWGRGDGPRAGRPVRPGSQTCPRRYCRNSGSDLSWAFDRSGAPGPWHRVAEVRRWSLFASPTQRKPEVPLITLSRCGAGARRWRCRSRGPDRTAASDRDLYGSN